MMWKSIVLTAALPAFLMIACGGKEEPDKEENEEQDETPLPPTSSAEGKESSCQDFCAEIESCEGVDTTDCVASCSENKATSRAGQEAFTTCFSASLCESESETDLLLAIACLPSQLSGLELSQTQKTYCSETVPAFNACAEAAATPSPLGDCEDVIGAASDEAIEAFNKCAARDCEAMQACATAALLQSIDFSAISAVSSGGELSPAALTNLLTIGLLASQLGLSDDSTGGLDIDDIFGGGTDPSDPSDPSDPDTMGTAGATGN